jgi:hypothetical protein
MNKAFVSIKILSILFLGIIVLSSGFYLGFKEYQTLKFDKEIEIEKLKKETAELKKEQSDVTQEKTDPIIKMDSTKLTNESQSNQNTEEKEKVVTINSNIDSTLKTKACEDGRNFLKKFYEVVLTEQNTGVELAIKAMKAFQTSAILAESQASDALKSYQSAYDINRDNVIPLNLPSNIQEKMLLLKNTKSKEILKGKEASQILITIAQDYKDGLVSQSNQEKISEVTDLIIFDESTYTKTKGDFQEIENLLTNYCE